MKLILLVEDNPMIPTFITHRYSNKYVIEWVSSVKEAKSFLDTAFPDIIITDLNMPEETGYELIRYVKETNTCPSTPIIVLSGKNQANDRVAAYELGANFFLSKPFLPRELDIILDNISLQYAIS